MMRVGVGVAAVALLATGCSDHARRRGGQITKAGEIQVFKLRVGDCIVPPQKVRAEIAYIKAVPCSDPHPQEVYAKANWPQEDDPYPGDQALKTFSEAQCNEQFEGYVGVPYSDSKIFYTYLAPSPRSWTDRKDRTVTCILTTTGANLPWPVNQNTTTTKKQG